jgi:hypothetical protein
LGAADLLLSPVDPVSFARHVVDLVRHDSVFSGLAQLPAWMFDTARERLANPAFIATAVAALAAAGVLLAVRRRYAAATVPAAGAIAAVTLVPRCCRRWTVSP